MPLITNNTTQTVEDFVAQHKKRVGSLYSQLVMQFKMLGKSFWDNPNFTPEELVAAYGNEAVELFTLSGQLQAFLAAVSGAEINIVPEGIQIIPNGDGTVTLVRDEESSSSQSGV